MSAGKSKLALVMPPHGDDGDAYRLDDQIGFLLRKASQRHIAIFARHIEELTPPQFAALAKLREVGSTSQNQLGALVAMDAATIKGVIDRLRTRGLVIQKPDGEDKRRLMISLTPEGRDTVERLTPLAHQLTQDTLAPLGERDRATLTRLLAKLT